MGANFDAIFSPAKKSVDEIIRLTSAILQNSGLTFQRNVWKLRSVGKNPEIATHEPVLVKDFTEVAYATRKWWGRSMEWFSQRVGEVFFSVFSADDDRYHVVYNEGRRVHRMREQDQELQRSLISMLLQISEALESDICTYRCESVDDFRPPSLTDLEDAIRLGKRWDGEICIVAESCVPLALKAELAQLQPGIVRRATTGHYIVNYLGARNAL